MTTTIYSCELTGTSEKGEVLVLNTSLGNILVRIGKYEKRPCFCIQNWGHLGNYNRAQMYTLLDAVVMAYNNLLVYPFILKEV